MCFGGARRQFESKHGETVQLREMRLEQELHIVEKLELGGAAAYFISGWCD